MGTEVLIRGILPGIKNFSGDKIQWYLASELRDRIRHSGVAIRVVDRTARAEYKVEPRQFEGRLLHELDGALPPQSEVYAELYLHAHSPANAVSLYRSGTRVLGNLTELEAFARLALGERLCARDHRCALSQPDAGHAARRHPRCGAGASGR